MGMSTEDLPQVIAGLMAIEKRVIELANERKIGGLRFEWNDGLDFGHLQDPVPVSIYAPRAKMAEAEFPHADLARFAAGSQTATAATIHRVVQELGEEG